jgi:ribosomal subunit interface protein
MNTFDINKIQLTIQSPHFKVNDELNNYLIAEVEKLGKTYSRIDKCEIVLRVIANKPMNNGEVEVKLFVPGNVLFATVKNSDFKLASKKVFEDLKEQLSKFKEKITDNTF